MLKLQITNSFKQDYKLIKRRGYNIELLEEVVNKLLKREKLNEKYRNHQLTGKLSGMWECHIKPDWILVYKIDEERLILQLCYTGTHSDLF